MCKLAYKCAYRGYDFQIATSSSCVRQHRRAVRTVAVIASPAGDTSTLERPPLERRPLERSAPSWTTGVVIIALLVGLAGIGVGAYALATQPAKVSGPVGPQGPQGQQGPRGPQGLQGSQGKQGPAGAIASTSITRGTSKVTTPNPQPGTVLEATTSCPTGQILLGGGAQVTAPGVTADRNVTLRSSFPLNPTSWETVALVTRSLGQGTSMTMTPYVLCGQSAASTSTTTTKVSTP